jgi:hypothetical protein
MAPKRESHGATAFLRRFSHRGPCAWFAEVYDIEEYRILSTRRRVLSGALAKTVG